jgi:hypothetical protein
LFALSARHSSVQAFAVFCPLVGNVGAGAAAVGAGAGAGAVAVGVVPPRHVATYAFSVMPLAWLFALSARHSSVQAFAVFCWAMVSEENATNANIVEQTEIKSCFLISPPPSRTTVDAARNRFYIDTRRSIP